jgi:putative FmdB family regulatory protein
MPTYDYVCLNCKKHFDQFFTYSEYGSKPAICPFCHSKNSKRKIGRIRVAKSEENRMASMANPEALDGIDEDPQKLGSMMRKMSSEMGEDMGPEFNEVVGRLEKGQSPEQIEKDIPGLGSEGMNPPMGSNGFNDDF